MESKEAQAVVLESSREHQIRNWLVIQRYRLIFRYRLPRRPVLIMLFTIERVLTYLKVLA